MFNSPDQFISTGGCYGLLCLSLVVFAQNVFRQNLLQLTGREWTGAAPIHTTQLRLQTNQRTIFNLSETKIPKYTVTVKCNECLGWEATLQLKGLGSVRFLYLNDSLNQWSQTQFLEGHISAQFSSSPNQTHLIQIIKLFRINRNLKAGVSWAKLKGCGPPGIEFETSALNWSKVTVKTF